MRFKFTPLVLSLQLYWLASAAVGQTMSQLPPPPPPSFMGQAGGGMDYGTAPGVVPMQATPAQVTPQPTSPQAFQPNTASTPTMVDTGTTTGNRTLPPLPQENYNSPAPQGGALGGGSGGGLGSMGGSEGSLPRNLPPMEVMQAKPQLVHQNIPWSALYQFPSDNTFYVPEAAPQKGTLPPVGAMPSWSSSRH